MSLSNKATSEQRALWQRVADMNSGTRKRDIDALATRLVGVGSLDFRKTEGEPSLAAVMLGKLEAGAMDDNMARHLLDTLIDAGLNPLLEPQGARGIFNGQSLCHPQAGQWLIQALARAEVSGRGLRGAMGETIAHLVATSIDEQWFDTRLADMDDPAWAGDAWPLWINAQDTLGQTPLHRCLGAFMTGGKQELWLHIQMLGMMAINGNALRLDIPDHQGRCAWQWMLEIWRQSKELDIMPGLMTHLLACEARALDQQLEQGTAQASRLNLRGGRL